MSLWMRIGLAHTSVFSRHHLVFPATGSCARAFPRSGQRRDQYPPSPVYLLSSLAKQREMTGERWRGPRVPANRGAPFSLWGDNGDWSGHRETNETGETSDRKSAHLEVQRRPGSLLSTDRVGTTGHQHISRRKQHKPSLRLCGIQCKHTKMCCSLLHDGELYVKTETIYKYATKKNLTKCLWSSF